MSVIDVISEKKGGNPGGKVRLDSYSPPQLYYAKHCNSSRVTRRESSFVYTHQPVYEAVTCEMARELGLKLPDFYVLDNRKNKVNFRADGCKSDLKDGKPFYFLSFMVSLQESVPDGDALVKRESVYRDILQISDIVGRRQNYTFLNGGLFYLDVGCAFVDAHQGHIGFRRQHPKLLDKKPLKSARKRIGRYDLVLLDGESIDLLDFVDMPRDLLIPVMTSEGDKTSKRLDSLITNEEIDEICNRIVGGIIKGKVLQHNGDSSYLSRKN